MKKGIKFLIMDVDGTLTDGKIYCGDSGELFKVFNVRDGYGIKEILPFYGIIPIILTGRNSAILIRRCSELHIKDLHQDVKNKTETLKQILKDKSIQDQTNYCFQDCAYIGDDLPDLDCMKAILAAGGQVGCPSDAIDPILEISNHISKKKGGEGAVRDFIDWLITAQ